MENITHRTVVQNHDFAQIGLDLAQILDVGAVAEGAVLTVVSAAEVLALALEPVDDGVGVFLDGSGEDYEVVPFADLERGAE